MRKITLLVLFISFFLVSACSQNSDAVYQASFDFSKVKSYSIYQRNSSFTDTQSMTDTRRNSIEIAIEKTMEKQGLEYKIISQADIIITYHLLNGKRNDYHDYNKEVLFCHRCLKANNWQKGDDDLKIASGSLIIDLINPQKKRSVWRSIAPLDLDDEDNSREVNIKIQQEVSTMLQQYPAHK